MCAVLFLYHNDHMIAREEAFALAATQSESATAAGSADPDPSAAAAVAPAVPHPAETPPVNGPAVDPVVAPALLYYYLFCLSLCGSYRSRRVVQVVVPCYRYIIRCFVL